jgi:hypothetical protein
LVKSFNQSDLASKNKFNKMKKYLFYLAVTGWTLGLLVHLLALSDIDVSEKIPFVWALHVGIFIVWLPAVLELKKNKELQEFQKGGMMKSMNPFAMFKIVFKNTPLWMVALGIGGFFYAIINFMLFISSQHGTPDIKEGQYILQNHGQLIKTLTEQEYHHYKANAIRGFSGHWMAFYGLAAAILYPFQKSNEPSQL